MRRQILVKRPKSSRHQSRFHRVCCISTQLAVALSVLSLAPTRGSAQTRLTIDLGKIDTGKVVTEQLPATGTYQVMVVNAVPSPSHTYTILTQVAERSIDALTSVAFKGQLSYSDAVSAEFKFHTGVKSTYGICDDEVKVDSALTQLRSNDDEKKVEGTIKTALVLVDTATVSPTNCFDDKDVLRAAILGTVIRKDVLQAVSSGEDLIVIISRHKGADVDKVWTIKYSGENKGKWLVTYGFSFIWNQWSRNSSYTAEAVRDSANTFVIRRDNNNNTLSFYPTVYFTWLPTRYSCLGWHDLACGPSAGLGFDLSNPALFGSLSFTYNQNLTLHLGLAAANVSKLLGRYHDGDTVATNLTPDQLKQSVYRVNPFFSISLNFGSNPFASSSTDKSTSAGKSSPAPTEPGNKPSASSALEDTTANKSNKTPL